MWPTQDFISERLGRPTLAGHDENDKNKDKDISVTNIESDIKIKKKKRVYCSFFLLPSQFNELGRDGATASSFYKYTPAPGLSDEQILAMPHSKIYLRTTGKIWEKKNKIGKNANYTVPIIRSVEIAWIKIGSDCLSKGAQGYFLCDDCPGNDEDEEREDNNNNNNCTASTRNYNGNK